MAIRELARLRQMKIENFTAERARAELIRVRDQLIIEDAALNERLARMSRLEEETSSLQAELARVTTRDEAVTAELREALGRTQIRIAELEAERVTLLGRIEAQDVALEGLQQAAAESADQSGVVDADIGAFMKRFAAEITATEVGDGISGFTLSHLDIDLRVPVGLKANKPVMRFASTAPTGPESASRIQFRLERKVKLRPVEDAE